MGRLRRDVPGRAGRVAGGDRGAMGGSVHGPPGGLAGLAALHGHPDASKRWVEPRRVPKSARGRTVTGQSLEAGSVRTASGGTDEREPVGSTDKNGESGGRDGHDRGGTEESEARGGARRPGGQQAAGDRVWRPGELGGIRAMGRCRRAPGCAAEWCNRAMPAGRGVAGGRAALGGRDGLPVRVAFEEEIVTVALGIGGARLGGRGRGCVIVETGGGRRARGANKARGRCVLAVHRVRRADGCVVLGARGAV